MQTSSTKHTENQNHVPYSKEDAAYRAFAEDMHNVLKKHGGIVAAGRSKGVQMAITRELEDMLAQHDGSYEYLCNMEKIGHKANDNSVFYDRAQQLIQAGYIKGQTYQQCMSMAEWHPEMANFMASLGANGSQHQQESFGFAQMYVDQLLENAGNTMPC